VNASAASVSRFLALAILIVLAVGTAYEAGVALGWIEMSSVPGEEPAGRDAILTAALITMMAGALLAVAWAIQAKPGGLAALLAPAAAAFVVARFYSFDSYYLPTLRRMSDGGSVSGSWIVLVVALALAAGALVVARPRVGLIGTALLFPTAALTALAVGLGH
jgi:hypothetical protein